VPRRWRPNNRRCQESLTDAAHGVALGVAQQRMFNRRDQTLSRPTWSPQRVACLAVSETVLIKSLEDWTMPILGFEHETYMCPSCVTIEQRSVFDKHAKEKHEAEIAAAITPPPTASVDGRASRGASGLLGRYCQPGLEALTALPPDKDEMRLFVALLVKAADNFSIGMSSAIMAINSPRES
jgi:hypothetical protein